ncbi:HNH endonuclease domain protein [Mycobacterium kansasii 824]|nr:HNH endonuclease domain protein [Mycobacterium kansasii 824]
MFGGGWGWKGSYHHQSARSPMGPGTAGRWAGVGLVGVPATLR